MNTNNYNNNNFPTFFYNSVFSLKRNDNKTKNTCKHRKNLDFLKKIG